MSRGKHKSKRGRGGRKGGGGGEAWANHRPRADYQEIVKSNPTLEAFYSKNGVIPDDQLDTFWTTMRRELPVSFRFTGSKGHALVVQQRLIDHYIPEISAVKYNGELVQPPTPLPWYPENLAWSMTTPKNIVRRFDKFANFQKFLVSETSVGNISRQEVVSMIPPLVMDLQPGMTCLDMCAAPGSKSAQLIEMVHAGEEARTRKIAHDIVKQQQKEPSPDGMEVLAEQRYLGADGDWSDDGRSTGLLIANDSNYQRAQMLIHQVKRLNSPNLIVTNHDASIFPSIKIASEAGTTKYLKFDRILADVPCSGDGTARKNPGIWKDWQPSSAMGLHSLQVRILVRALQMLKVGGRAVYSTCSMNPVENEAVIASAIQAVGGLAQVKIVDCRDLLPALKRVPGLTDWKLMDRYERFFGSWEEIKIARKDKEVEHRESLDKFTHGMFSPSSSGATETIPLENCMRVYPHLQDTGGFFITVLEKVSEIKATTNEAKPSKQVAKAASQGVKREREADDEVPESSKRIKAELTPEVKDESAMEVNEKPIVHTMDGTLSNVQDESSIQNGNEALPTVGDEPIPEVTDTPKLDVVPDTNRDVMATKSRSQALEEVYKYLDTDHPVLQEIIQFYHLSSRFPVDRYMVRNATGEPAKAIYYTSALVRDILTVNEGKGIKFVQAGVKMFMRQDAQGRDICRWRIQSEGTPILDAWVGEERIVRISSKAALKKLLIEMFMKIDGPGWEVLGDIGPELKKLSMGCCLVRIEPRDGEDGIKERTVYPLWRSVAAVNLMLPKEERKALLLRLFNDNTPLIDHNVLRAQGAADEQTVLANGDINDGAKEEDVEAAEVPVKETADN